MTKFCARCGQDTPHTPLKKVGEFRCCHCGEPHRYGNKYDVARSASPTGRYMHVRPK